jgi:hypothetical protein
VSKQVRSALAGQTWNCHAARLDRGDCVVTLVFRASVTGIQKVEDGYGCCITLHAGDVRECSSSGGSRCSSSSSSWSCISAKQSSSFKIWCLNLSCPSYIRPKVSTTLANMSRLVSFKRERGVARRTVVCFVLTRRLSRGAVERTAQSWRVTVVDTDAHNHRG